jgi:hypothetical protein
MAKNVADCYKLFQSVAKCENLQIRRPDGLTPFSIVDEGELSTDGLEFAAAPQKSKIGSGPLALAAAYLTLHSHRAGHCGLERNRGGARERQEAQRGLGGRKLDGLEIPYPRFRVYVSRLRRRQRRSSAPQLPPVPTNVDHGPPDPPLDPFRNRREQREKKKQSTFEYDPFLTNG